MYDKIHPKIKCKRQPSHRSVDSLSEYSFLSEKFCYEVLGKPCVDKKNSNFARGHCNNPKIERHFTIPKQQLYNAMEELNIRQVENSNQSVDRDSERNMREISLVNKRGSYVSKNSEVEEQQLEEEDSKMSPEFESADSQTRYIAASQDFTDAVSKNSEEERSTSRYSTPLRNSINRQRNYSENSIRSKVDSKLSRNDEQRFSPRISKEASYPHSSFEPYSPDERARLSNEPQPAGGGHYGSIDKNGETWNKRYSKEREMSNKDVAPCYCDTDSQTNYPSILKQHRRSVNSSIDRYPVKECSWRTPKPKFVDATQQTSENRFVSNTNTNESFTGPLIDTSVNTLKAESASAQITEQSSSKVQTTDSSTPEEVCFRPIQEMCKCKETQRKYANGGQYTRRDQNHLTPSDRVINIETNVTVPPIMNHAFRNPPMMHKPSALPPEMRRNVQGSPQNIRSRRPTGIPTMRDTSDLIRLQDSEDDISDTYDDYQSDYRSGNGDVDRYQWYKRNSTECPKCLITNEGKYVSPLKGCRCCQNRNNTCITTPRRSGSYRPRPPPIDYDLTSSEDDFDLRFDDNDESDDNYFDHLENRHSGLPYQNNDQYMDLVQELEETLQTRNKTRVQRARNEFEYKSRLNEPLEKPIIDYEEPSDSEETLMKKISELAEKRRLDHKRFPCKGKACCNCVLKSNVKDNRSPPKPNVKSSKRNKQWQLNHKTGEWHKVPTDNSNIFNGGSFQRDHECGCTCACSRLVK